MILILNLDSDPEIKEKIGEHYSLAFDGRAWRAFDGLSTAVFSVAQICLQALMVISLFRKNSVDLVLLSICMAVPLIDYFTTISGIYGIWNQGNCAA